ncbi:ApbE family protein [Anaerococcus hydrogenalis DSM 7454]|uniref:FAD:protein FMN transferase n=1 Tax=Anaerococcus hydrogenalis DSM 7454 TaxID=561177 RepID=B6W649_9FIRM|nr:FAD:protein FMN transferase [Anaerococcus hydrogenalis]EEB37119.1 ApbE family protein [Anaerococcus hydrogenalis DSM 7454]
MNKKIKLTIVGLGLCLALSSCNKKVEKVKPEAKSKVESSISTENSNQEVKKYETTIYDYFDTITTFSAYCQNEEEFNKYKDLVEKRMAEYHKLFNNYDKFDGVNNVTTLNENAGKEKVKLDKKIIDLLNEGKKWYKETDGDINICYGRVLKIWLDHREAALEDEKNQTAYINDKEVQVDIGGIGKGYATELIKDELIEKGLKSGILSVGGDVAIIGENPTKKDGNFKIAVQDPSLSEEHPYSSIVAIKNTSLVTSGDYQRYFEIDGKRYHHIIDPNTNYPSTNFKSVSVMTDDISKADALSTALFIKNLEEGKKLAKKYKVEAYWIDQDGNTFKTENWDKYETEKN